MAIKHILRNNVLTLRLLIGATTVSIIAILSIVSFLLVREHRTANWPPSAPHSISCNWSGVMSKTPSTSTTRR